ncbi:MAG: pentapeptide repeat-containing protein [Phormidesmis sp.]
MNLFDLLKDKENGIEGWNHWRRIHPGLICDLAGENLSHGYFFEADFRRVNLKGANLQRACLIGSDLRGADLSGADLTGAYLGEANLYGANLSYANLSKANLDRADLRCANLLGTQIAEADIRTARLLDDSTHDRVDDSAQAFDEAIAIPLSQSYTAHEPVRIPKVRLESPKHPASRAYRRSLLQQMAFHLQPLTRQSPEAAMLRQQAIRQAIRQSAVPAPISRPIQVPFLSAVVHRERVKKGQDR